MGGIEEETTGRVKQLMSTMGMMMILMTQKKMMFISIRQKQCAIGERRLMEVLLGMIIHKRIMELSQRNLKKWILKQEKPPEEEGEDAEHHECSYTVESSLTNKKKMYA